MATREPNYMAPPRRVPEESQPAQTQTRGAKETLPSELAAEMGVRFGADFGNVRVRRDAAAAQEARNEDAQAFARGNDIAFAAGRYDPESGAGKKLIAHELAHVVQQRRGGATSEPEARADHAADEALRGGAVNAQALGGAPAGIQLQPEEKKPDAPKTGDAAKDEYASPEKEKDEGPTTINSYSKILDKFALNEPTLTPDHIGELDKLALGISLNIRMLARGRAKIEIVGHADTSGPDEPNMTLGQERADAVKTKLESNLAAGATPPSIDWSVRSAGETEPLIKTGDNKREARNRRVEIKVTILSMPAPKPPPNLNLDMRKYVFGDPPPIPQKKPEDDWWQRMQDAQKRIDDYAKKHPKDNKSLQGVIVDAVMDSVVTPLVRKLPVSKDLQDKARDAIKGGIESGTEKACESAIDATGAKGTDANALKAACKAAIKMKPGEKPSGGNP